MIKDPKFIKVKFNRPKTALPPIPDLVLNFASDVNMYTIRVKASEMGNMAAAFCALMKHYEVTYTVEERPR